MLDGLLRRVGRLEQIAGVTPVVLQDGWSNGVRALEVRNISGLRAMFIADRAMDMLSLEWRGVRLAWQSQNGVAAPQYYDPEGDNFLRTFFGGMLTTCGLANFGPASEDPFGRVGLHGSINHTPAQSVSYGLNESAAVPCLQIHGTVRQSRVFGENLRLERTWVMPLQGNTVSLHDRVTNDADGPWPHMLLYHCNAGHPLLSEDLRIHLSHAQMRARDAAAQTGLEVWNRGDVPKQGFTEQVFIHTMRNMNDSWSMGLFANDRLGIGLAVRFRCDQLPFAFTWRMLGEKTYVMAIEPANCPAIEGRAAAIESGTLPMLQPGESREYDLHFEIIDDLKKVDEYRQALK